MTSQRMHKSLLVGATKWDPDLFDIPKVPCGGSLRFWRSACHSCFTWDPSKLTPSKHCKLGKKFKLSSWELRCKVDLSEQSCTRGSFPSMRRLLSSSSRPLQCKRVHRIVLTLFFMQDLHLMHLTLERLRGPLQASPCTKMCIWTTSYHF